jgi:predicted nucleic acid-binding protein
MAKLEVENVQNGAKICLDTVVFVYFLEKHPNYFRTSKELFTRIEAGQITAVMSALVFAELLVPLYRDNDSKRADTLIHLLSNFPNLQVMPVTQDISVEAARLRANYGIRTPDAIHAATALKGGAGSIVTNDKNFLKLSELIDIVLFTW